MNYEKFFELAKSRGIEQSQIYVGKSSSFRVKLFRKEIETYSYAQSQSITVTGIYQGKYGSASTNKLDKDTFEYLVNQLIISAKYTEKPAEVDLFPGSPKYKKGFVYNKELEQIPAQTKIDKLFELEKAILEADERVSEANAVGYSESSYERLMMNSFGLKLRDKGNTYSFVAGAVIKDKDETKTYYDFFLDNDFSKFDVKPFAARIVEKALSKLGGKPCEAKKYPTVLSKEIIADFISVFLDSCSADEVQRHSSFLEGKLKQKVASAKLTIEENPFAKNLYYYYFDDEGVAAKRKTIVKNGVLQLYFHNRETAKKEGGDAESTGNGRFAGKTMRIGYSNIFVKPGKQSFEEMIAPIEDGVFITEVAGLESGLNEVSGDFSCQAEGYRIRNGKVAEPLNLITLSGNILKTLEGIRYFDNDVELLPGGMTISNAFINKMNVGGL